MKLIRQKWLWLLLAAALVLAPVLSRAVDPNAQKEVADVVAGTTGTVAQFNATAAALAETADIVAAPSAGTHIQIIWLDWVPNSTGNVNFAILNAPSGTNIFTGKAGTTAANAVNNFKPDLKINLTSASAFRIKNLDAGTALDIRVSFRYIIVND